jgi:DNA-binding transcriptional regulator YiaG
MIHGERCGNELVTKRLSTYSPNLGLDGVKVCNAASRVVCKTCRTVIETVIPNMGELIAAAALARVKVPVRLTNKDVRFLRRALGWQSKTLAKEIGVAPESFSKWESPTNPSPISPAHEKLLRMIVVQNLKDRAPGVFVKEREILSMDIRDHTERIVLRFWRVLLKENREAQPEEVWDLRATGTDG